MTKTFVLAETALTLPSVLQTVYEISAVRRLKTTVLESTIIDTAENCYTLSQTTT